MAVFRCKMCGGTLEINSESVATCEYCGTQQTFSKTNDELMQNLFNRANNLRLRGEFDKAEQIYEKILQENSAEAEAYWGIVLCKYGIEYVEDPKTYTRIPTCHRTSYEAVTTDANYLAAITHADAAQRSIYEAEAKAIDAIQKDILSIVKNEKPFDVFICYKETDETGRRTPDSVIANDIYHQLTQEGLKVFYAAITLEDKLGQAYEPYIFAALNSAKVMLVIGTKPEYFNAVWVKNEWSRFLKLMKTDRSKLLIPCYRDLDAYDLPEEFAHLQAQDMGKIGFINDVVRGIKKVTVKEESKATVVMQAAPNTNTSPLLQRVFIFLEDGDWQSADEYCEKVLDLEPQNAQAYLGKLMAQLRVRIPEDLKNCEKPFAENNHYKKVLRFADDDLRNTMTGYNAAINERIELARLEGIYQDAVRKMGRAATEEEYKAVAKLFASIVEYKDAAALARQCKEKAVCARKDAVYAGAKRLMTGNRIASYQEAIKKFEEIPNWKDSADQIAICTAKIAELNELKAQKAQKAQKEVKKQVVHTEKPKKSKLPFIAAAVVCIAVIAVVIGILPKNEVNAPSDVVVAVPETEAAATEVPVQTESPEERATALLEEKYSTAVSKMNAGQHMEAISIFLQLDGYKDSAEQVRNFWDQVAVRETISASHLHTVGLKADGTVVATKYTGDDYYGQCEVSDWKDIVAISGGYRHTVGLKADGTVVATKYTGDYYYGQCEVSDWKDIVAISAGSYHTVGLKADGTVVAVGRNTNGQCDVSDWKDIVAIGGGYGHTVGLKADGTVVATKYTGDYYYGQCEVSDWKDIVAISASHLHTVGLKADGTVVAVGWNMNGQCETSGWKDIVAISAGSYHTVGLKADGTVVAVGHYKYGQCDVSDWKDIVAISAGERHTVGLKADGTVVAVGRNTYGQRNVSDWTDIKLPEGASYDLSGEEAAETAQTSALKEHYRKTLRQESLGYEWNFGCYGRKSDGTLVVAPNLNPFGHLIYRWEDITRVSATSGHAVGLKTDGTVITVGEGKKGECDVSHWTDIVDVIAFDGLTIGLKKDGTMVATDRIYALPSMLELINWTDVVAIYKSRVITGLKADGTVVAVGDNGNGQCNVSDWKDIVTIATSFTNTVGLRADGTVVATGRNNFGQCDVNGWTDIVAIASSNNHTVGLKADGTVVATGWNEYGQCNIDSWKDIVAISTSDNHTVGLKADGTVVAVGYNERGQCDVDSWKDIVAISTGGSHTVGLKADGTVVAVGYSKTSTGLSNWKDIKIP